MNTEFEIVNGTLERYSGSNSDVVIPDGVIVIDETIWNCPPVTSIKLPDSLRIIDSYAFEDCHALKEIEIPENVKTIGTRAFMGCTSLEKINLPRGLTTLGPEAFYSCISLRGITVPAACVIFGDKMFRDCNELSVIKVDEKNDLYDSRENCNAVIRKTNSTLVAGCYNTHIPDSVLEIGNGAFYECKKLSRLVLGKNITTIGRDAFGGCVNLKSIELSESVRIIEDRAFWNCQSLDTIILYDTIKSLGKDVFYFCSNIRKIHVISTSGNNKIESELFSMTGIDRQTTIKNAVADDDIDFIARFGSEYITKENYNELMEISARNNSTEVSAYFLKVRDKYHDSDDDLL